ncbi:MAG: cysteine desulfurase NifS [Planctomycetaceae bacterium]|nr:cysteine desulfurase NifS [Planctomycetaceae bacterium]
MPDALIYLDNNATTPIAPEVRGAMTPYLSELYFNPSSMYEPATGVRRAIESARESIAAFLNASSAKELLFTSCATESNNMAVFGPVRALPQRKHILTTAVEHPATLEVCRELQRTGYDVTFLSVDRNGNLDIGEYVRALRSDTLLVTIMHANNETGVVFPIERLARIAKETNPSILFHTDATQSFTKLPIRMQENFRHVDMLSFSGHKFHAPKGIGGIYIRRGTPCRTFMIGGHQENERRGGTENVAGIVAMGKAVELSQIDHDREMQRIAALRDRLERGILENIPCVEVNGAGATRMPNTLNVACHYVEGEGILYQLSESGICASSGSACTSGSLEPSHVLKAMGIPFTAMHGSVRFSLSRYTTEQEIDKVLEVFPSIIDRLRRLSPYWDYVENRPREITRSEPRTE